MAVAVTVTLPATPSTGSLTYVPLGGDGFTAPQAAYVVRALQVTGDAGGGAATLTIHMDPRFTSLVAYVTAQNDQASSADADLRLVITPSTGIQIAALTLQQPVVATSATVNSTTIGLTWNPTPLLMPGAANTGRIIMKMLNVLADEYRLSAHIYLFNIRVRELTPMGPLLWARGAT